MRKKIRAARKVFLKPLRDARKALNKKFRKERREAIKALKTGQFASLIADWKKKMAEMKEAFKASKTTSE